MPKFFLLLLFMFSNTIFMLDKIYSIEINVFNTNSLKSFKQLKDDLVFADFFSPNGDGHNDTFVIKNIDEYPINKLHVFNRWGEIVYQSEPYRNDWDGKMNIENQWFGNELPEGMYFYRFEYIIGDFITQRNGKIILKR